MKTILLILAVALFPTHSLSFQGHYWVKMTKTEKVAYVRGVKDGAFVGCFEATGDREAAKKCNFFTSGNYSGKDIDTLIDVIDGFFAAPENRIIDMIGVVGLAARSINGEDVSKILIDSRKSAMTRKD